MADGLPHQAAPLAPDPLGVPVDRPSPRPGRARLQGARRDARRPASVSGEILRRVPRRLLVGALLDPGAMEGGPGGLERARRYQLRAARRALHADFHVALLPPDA